MKEKEKNKRTKLKKIRRNQIYSREQECVNRKQEMKSVSMFTNLRMDLLPRCVLLAELLRAGNQEQALSPPSSSLLKTFRTRDASPPFREFVRSLGTFRFTRMMVLSAAVGQRLVCLHLIGGGDLVHPGAHTQQMKRGLIVYTSLCTQPSSSSCDWLTRFSYIA